ncbi:aldose 1-epimerase [Rhizobiaceae bacterium LC148]|nr:aldose 1-epimerase [Rhizobiaceae bacterium LC148]
MCIGSDACRSGRTDRMPSPEGLVVLENGPLTAVFQPKAGGRMLRLSHRDHGEVLVPLGTDPFDPLYWPKGGAYPLFPFHNKLEGGTFSFEERAFQVMPHPTSPPDALHGPAHRRPWCVTAHERTSLTMVLDYAADDDWPFDFRAEQSFTLDSAGLALRLSLQNKAKATMPAGFGWHPYFAADLSRPVFCDALVEHASDRASLPTHETRPYAAECKLLAGEFTRHFSGARSADVLVDCGLIVRMNWQSPLDYLVVHRMPTYLCLEPVSHLGGALRYPDSEKKAFGLAALTPGAFIQADVAMSIRKAD